MNLDLVELIGHEILVNFLEFKDCECSEKGNWRVPERGRWESWKEMRMRDWRGFEKPSGDGGVGGGAACGWQRLLDRIGTKVSDDRQFELSL